MFEYQQSTGVIKAIPTSPWQNHPYLYPGRGYSGAGVFKNNPEAESLKDKGPIPKGEYGILGPPAQTADHGPYVLHLYAKPGTETYGRSGFLIHGDSVTDPGTASKGCIVLDRRIRQIIWESGDRDLRVIP